jgi:hypothetical protein
MTQHFHFDVFTETRYKFHVSLLLLFKFKRSLLHISDVSQSQSSPNFLLTVSNVHFYFHLTCLWFDSKIFECKKVAYRRRLIESTRLIIIYSTTELSKFHKYISLYLKIYIYIFSRNIQYVFSIFNYLQNIRVEIYIKSGIC